MQQKSLTEKDKEHLQVISEIKNRELFLAISQKISYNKILVQIKEAVKTGDDQKISKILNQNINTENNWDNFIIRFIELYPDFFAKLKEAFPNLTKNEERLSALLFMNLKSKEISNVLNISDSSVNKSRQRLRKKMELAHGADISNCIKGHLELN